jgi:hypothetical protein
MNGVDVECKLKKEEQSCHELKWGILVKAKVWGPEIRSQGLVKSETFFMHSRRYCI